MRVRRHGVPINILWHQFPIKHQPDNDHDGQVGDDLPPYHVDVRAAQGAFVRARLLDGLPYGQESEADGEPGRHRGDLIIGFRRHSQMEK